MEKEKSPKFELEKELGVLKETLDYEYYNFRIKTLAEKIKSESSTCKLKTINY